MKKRKLLRSSLNSLLVFHEVAKHKSFSKAAEGLFISQPAVTKHIKDLELRVGMGLIQRGRGGFFLTEAGKTPYSVAIRRKATPDSICLTSRGHC